MRCAKFGYALLLALGTVCGSDYCRADNSWGGSLALTSDYLVRGISRSDNHAALQFDLHYFSADTGLITGLFASSAQIDPDQSRDVELDAFLGYAWNAGADWRGQVRATYYSYPWNQAGSAYNYSELDVDVVYQDCLQLAVIYSPDAPRYVPYRGFVGVSSSSVEANFQHRIYDKLSGIAGVGYSYLGGPAGAGYEYWSTGAAYDVGHATFVVSYVGSSKSANSLFYMERVSGRVDASIIWRF
jgi:uncharacterized protein (TIGR02001 family)